MHSTVRILFALALTLAAAMAHAADDGPSPNAWTRFKAFTHAQKQAAVHEGRQLMAATDRQIDEMKAQAKSSGHETRAAWKANMAELEARKKATQAHLDKLSDASANAWDATKEGFANAYQDLHDAVKKAAGSEPK